MKGKTSFKRMLILVFLSLFVLMAAPSLAAEKMLIGSTSASSSHYGYFVAVSQVVNDKVANLETSVVETGATVDNLRRIARNQIDFGMVTTNVMAQAYYGKESFAGNPVKAKLLWVYVIAPQNVIVRKDSGITSIAGLSGKKFNPGLKGSASEKTSEAVLKVIGVAPDYYRGSTTDIVSAVKDNNIVGYVKSGAGLKLDASTRDISTFTPISILTLSSDQAAQIQKDMPELSVMQVPSGAGPGLEAYTTWGFAVACAAGLKMDEDTAYRIVKAICEDKTVQAAAMSSVKNVDLVEMTLKYATSPLHPGAIRYFKERGAAVPSRLM